MATAIDDKVMRRHIANHYSLEALEIIEGIAGIQTVGRLRPGVDDELRKLIKDAVDLLAIAQQDIKDEKNQ